MPRSQTVGEFLAERTKELQNTGISTARLDCLVLLEDATGEDRSWLLSHQEFELPEEMLHRLDTQLSRRAKHVPLAYIRGKSEFYGRTFLVSPQTLVPRPETENVIELLKRLELPAGTRILDIGTGSGCIAITAALEFPRTDVTASDIDEQCLDLAKRNADLLGAQVNFIESNLLKRIDVPIDVVTANLPYVPDNFQINTAATYEPRHALFAGADGLDMYRDLFRQLSVRASQPRYVLTECLPPQHEVLADIAKASGYTLRTTEDFIQLFVLAN